MPEGLWNLTRKNLGAGRWRSRTWTGSLNRNLPDFADAAVVLPFDKGFPRGAAAMPIGHAAFHRTILQRLRPLGNRRRRPACQQHEQSNRRAPVDGANDVRRMEILEVHCLIQGVTGKTLHARASFVNSKSAAQPCKCKDSVAHLP